ERAALVSGLLTALFGCDAALVVNNNAAAVLLALTTLAKGKEVIVSRGQQVEIGGSFRMPDVMRLSGARMVEVGTTNRTRAADYDQAVTPRTAVLLRVHTSNFRVMGFTESASLAELSAVARRHSLLLVDDLGSGASGATLRQRLPGHANEIPVERMLHSPVEDVRRRAAMWSVKLAERGVETNLIEGSSAVGGGSLPEHAVATVLLSITGPASRWSTALRRGDPPVIARIEKDVCCLDPRTVLRGEDETLIDAVEVAARGIAR